jgi:20S proteasome subunit beta 4
MDFHVGIRGNGFAMLCTDTRAVQQIINIKDDEQKFVPLDKHRVFAISGEAGDRVHFSEFVVANVKLYALRNGHALSTHAVANFTRNELARALRQV